MGNAISSLFDQDEVLRQWKEAERSIEVAKLKRKLVIKRTGWKTVRIFVSSTFRDFHAEREVLVKQVFPDLRAWCSSRRIHLVECDLRWGVPKDTASEDTLRICLGELDRCYEDNILPFFLNMTSERCGWVPGKDDVPKSLAKEYHWVFGLSVTEMEIMHGAYRRDNPNSLFAIREDTFVETVPDDRKDDFVDSNPVAPQKTQMLKKRLHGRFPDERVFRYSCNFAGIDEGTGKVNLDGLRQFAQTVFEFFKGRIEDQYPLDTSTKLDPYQVHKEQQEAFMKSRSAVVIGRDGVINRITSRLRYSSYSILLVGAPGSGKSSIMARIADVCGRHKQSEKTISFEGYRIFYHFVGAVPGSTDTENMLRRMLREMEICNDSNMPKDFEEAAQLVRCVLANENTRRTVIIIDALNQLDDADPSVMLSWLPREFSPSVTCVFSTVIDTSTHRFLMGSGGEDVFEEHRVSALDMNSRKDIVDEVLGQYGKKLDKQQMNQLLSKSSSENPLWLSIACEELRIFGVFEQVTEKIGSLEDNLPRLLSQVFDRCEKENGGNLLVATVCLLEASKTGLLEVELLSILGGEEQADHDEDSQEPWKRSPHVLPAMKWAVVYRGLRSFLRPFGDSGEGRLDFYHRSLSKAVRQKYFNQEVEEEDEKEEGEEREGVNDDDDKSLPWHKKLADHFEHDEHIDRKVEEYPYQLCKINDKERLAVCLSEWEIFDKLYNPDYSNQLLAYWRNVDDTYARMETCYTTKIDQLRASSPNHEIFSRQLFQIAKLYVQSGLFEKARALLDEAIHLEQDELGNRPENMADILDTYGELCVEISKRHDFVTEEHREDIKPAIKYRRESVELRKTLEECPQQKYKLGLTLMRLSFNLNTWIECGGDETLSITDAESLYKDYIEQAINIFEESEDDGNLAEAIMTKALVYPRGDAERLDLFLYAERLCLGAYGMECKLMTRILSNIGIFYEDQKNFKRSYEYFMGCKLLSIRVFGENHPTTISAKRTLEDPVYQSIASNNPYYVGMGRQLRAFKAAAPRRAMRAAKCSIF